MLLQVHSPPGGGRVAGVVGGGRDSSEPGHLVADHSGQSCYCPHGVVAGPASLHRPQLVDRTSSCQRTYEPHDKENTGVLCEVKTAHQYKQ